MSKFEFFNVPRIVFGRGQFSRVGQLTAQMGRAVLLVYNGSDALAERAASIIAAAGAGSAVFRQRGEPKVGDVDAALEVARRANCDVVIGLGGGSAIDCAKAVDLCLAAGIEDAAALDDFRIRFTYPDKLEAPTLPDSAPPAG